LVGRGVMVACSDDPCKGMEVSTGSSVVVTPYSILGKEMEVFVGNSVWKLGVVVFYGYKSLSMKPSP
jgi:hypothetical protein